MTVSGSLSRAHRTAAQFTPGDRELLLRLLELPTAGPLETRGRHPVRLWEAQQEYARAAGELGFEVVSHRPADPSSIRGDDVPKLVKDTAQILPDFLGSQPSLVLRLGPQLPRRSTVMFNVHLDTTSGNEPVRFDGARFHGRGAIDAKGPAVALLAGVRAALAASPAVGAETAIIIQAVAGEEGGAMGSFGTRPLVEQGYVGRLNVFCEPTGLRLLTRSTAAMTACIEVAGHDAIDDEPGKGHNASVLLGFLAQHFARLLPPQVSDGQVCIAGLQTGPMHNKVYGTGRLLLNLSYGSVTSAHRMERALVTALDSGLTEFAERFAGAPGLALTAADAVNITRLVWLKRGLPALAPQLGPAGDVAVDQLVQDAGLARWPADEPAFTCDAIWMSGVPQTSTVVFGPGSLGANHAHAPGEFADLAELETFSHAVSRLLLSFTHNTIWSE
ncbi:MAG TPA: M20/M25/M40 family metallo-hydrolase [Streptosporangiaceae bacterium]|nr:M20/M25/M40 family metallo-hydrolase [Streptosporangiaceae bacterium]